MKSGTSFYRRPGFCIKEIGYDKVKDELEMMEAIL